MEIKDLVISKITTYIPNSNEVVAEWVARSKWGYMIAVGASYDECKLRAELNVGSYR